MNRIFIYNGIALNVDNDTDAEILLKKGGVELSPEKIRALGMSGYEHLISQSNTTVSADGTITFTPPAAPSLESLFTNLRTERDRRLAATDYLLMPDYPISDDQRAVVQAYRQALRDLPAQSGAPWDGGEEATPWPEIPRVLQEQQGSSTSSVYTPGVM